MPCSYEARSTNPSSNTPKTMRPISEISCGKKITSFILNISSKSTKSWQWTVSLYAQSSTTFQSWYRRKKAYFQTLGRQESTQSYCWCWERRTIIVCASFWTIYCSIKLHLLAIMIALQGLNAFRTWLDYFSCGSQTRKANIEAYSNPQIVRRSAR